MKVDTDKPCQVAENNGEQPTESREERHKRETEAALKASLSPENVKRLQKKQQRRWSR
jgi:hypothetical protein